jgi:hypothetical protein
MGIVLQVGNTTGNNYSLYVGDKYLLHQAGAFNLRGEEWNHIIIIRKSDSFDCYLNGALVSHTTLLLSIGASALPFQIGNYYLYDRPFSGNIRSLIIYNCAFNAQWVAMRWQQAYQSVSQSTN